MKSVARALSIGMALLAASPATAADWWLVSGVPGEPTAIFADVDTLVRQDKSAQVKVLRIEKNGGSTQTLQQIQCDTSSGSAEGETVRQFACASPKDRENYGLILAGMGPAEAAAMVFSTELNVAQKGPDEPRT